jgi:hypothetical protein
MPHASLKLRAGLDQNETPALNEAGISQSQLIRFIYDRVQGALIQKLGGWTKYYTNPMTAIVRALWAWADQNLNNRLAVGMQTSAGSANLSVIANGSLTAITPSTSTDNVTPAASTTSGSSTVTLTDNTNGGLSITQYDNVFIQTHISVGGLILFGQYQTSNPGASATTYNITATDALGNPQLATSTSTTTTVASFATTSGQSNVSVTLANHGYSVGSTYPVLVATTVGGITLYGNYTVLSVTSSSVFVIGGPQTASSSTTGSINGGNARLLYSFGIGSNPAGSGFGANGFGAGGFGFGSTISPSLGTAIAANDWTLDNWGQVLISCPVTTQTSNATAYQPIYQWDPSSGSTIATSIPQAPTVNDGIFVAMPQRQIIAWGSTFTGIQDPLLVRWCDVSNYNTWIAQTTNQAGSYRIPKGSRIVGALQGPQQGVIWTDIDVWSMQYIGQPYIYSFNEVGTGCGLIGRKAAGTINGVIYWMGQSSFYTLSGDGVQPIACPVWDVIFQKLDTTNTYKIRTAVNSRFGEIAWYYPTTTSGGEVAAYVKYNVNLGVWDFGTLGRSAWIDQTVLGPPIGADPSSLYIYQHETSNDADGAAMLSSFQSGYSAMSEGDYKIYVDQMWPDMKWGQYGGSQNATVNITFYTADYAGGPVTTYGPYSVNQSTTFISPRFRSRLLSIGVSSSDVGSFWRLGNIRYRFQQDGKY